MHLHNVASANTSSYSSEKHLPGKGRVRIPQRYIKPLLMIAAAMMAVTASFLAAPSHPAYAYGSGQICVFFAPTGAPSTSSGLPYFGHVGWGFRIDQQGDWMYGATENNSGQASVSPGGYNGAWTSNGSQSDMINIFAGDLPNTGNAQYPYYHHAGYYTQYRCKSTITSNVGSAIITAHNMQYQGYNLPNNDCLTDVIQVIDAYDSSILNVYPTGDATTGPSSIPAAFFYTDLNVAKFGSPQNTFTSPN